MSILTRPILEINLKRLVENYKHPGGYLYLPNDLYDPVEHREPPLR